MGSEKEIMVINSSRKYFDHLLVSGFLQDCIQILDYQQLIFSQKRVGLKMDLVINNLMELKMNGFTIIQKKSTQSTSLTFLFMVIATYP